MPPRKPITSSPEAVPLTAAQINLGIERLRQRIADLENFDTTKVDERWAPETKAIEDAIEDTLSRVFGHNSVRDRRYKSAAQLDYGGLSLSGGSTPSHLVRKYLADGKADALALFGAAVIGCF